MSDEGDVANDAASDGGDTEDGRGSGGRTAVVTVTRPQRPTGKRSRQRVADADEDVDVESPDEVEAAEKDVKKDKAKKRRTGKKAKKSRKSGDRSVNPVVFVYTYLKQVVTEMRKVIWPNRKQMLTYTSVVLAFLAFMVALVGLADFGLAKLVLLVFG
ncbi:preprotein translocase subunit SecE [Mycobacterium malmoense]|uniref:Protein translocase subunit SecE n=1 Tax=Mycobacterium malmoense TaxID=1780 RepID=A0ABX3SWS7_MYCMA|nr:preprotein translocase subunit SecE [Mycobacterium malmoense]ORA85062.1 preprotein translocase subunit SecE [Mycobacterium malmoense]QZA18381.1 preprotein translocase subunit SecE [Mycobacterium malmoense]UNB95153.1 preprotein translocase subunit SecE [Mycobacterium malmoense]